MSMHGGTIRILEAASFTTPQAVAIAEAIDTGIRSVDLVTLPALDSRLARIDVRFEQLERRIYERIDEKLSTLFWKQAGLALTAAGLIAGLIRYLR